MDEIEKLVISVKRVADGAKQAQIRFVECVSVDWENRTMSASASGDKAEYLDVALGFGYMDIRPAVGSACLIGVVDGQETAAFLINAEEVDLVEIKSRKIVYNGGENSGLAKAGELTKKINVLESDLNMLKGLLSAWMPVPQDGGASLKAVTASWAGRRIAETKPADMENSKITH
ncbi:MAG: hypothetical protein LBJ47_12155 [Tannerella sp.]|jgi:hypothetical protein|nr:hypothetical protein [Tannerella sp.]